MRGVLAAVILLLLVCVVWFATRQPEAVPALMNAPARADRLAAPGTAPIATPSPTPPKRIAGNPAVGGAEASRDAPPPDPFTFRSVYPQLPGAMIAASLDRAMSGDPAAQWDLYLAFDECAFAPQTEEAMEGVALQINDPLLARQSRWQFERCRDVLAEYSSPKAEGQRWHALAVAGGYPLAVLDAAVLSSPYAYRSDVDELPDEVIVAALRTGHPRALLNVKLLTRRLPEAERETRAMLWELLECRAAGGCSADAMMEYLQSRWLPHELDELVAEADRIEAAIASGDFSGVQIP